MAELEEVIPRRDYKLQPQLRKKCTKCGGILTLLSHNATLSQWCNSCRIIFNIQRACSYCDKVYEYDNLDCKICDIEIEALADAEGGVERNEKTIRRINRKYKRGEISEIDYQTQKELSKEEIELCTKEAEKIKEKRGIETHSENQTQKL